MSEGTIAILNSPVLTGFGDYRYREISEKEARRRVAHGHRSYIGHDSTAAVISRLLGIDCQRRRGTFLQEAGESALVFVLKQRLPEGQVATAEGILEVGFHWGLLTRVS